MKIKSKDLQELKKLAGRIQSPQQLVLILHKVENPSMRQAVYDLIRPYLKFSTRDNINVENIG